MKKIVIKKNDEKILMPAPGIFVNGYIIKATLCTNVQKDVLCTSKVAHKPNKDLQGD